MQPTDDGALLRQYAGNNSNDAFATLVTRYINLVYSVALRQVGNPHHAEEITQAVFIILAKKASELRHDKALSSWLFQTTRLTANNFVRSETRRQHREQEAYMQSTLNEPGSEVWPSIAPLLDTAVAGLSEKDRRAILLRFYEGRNLSDVGVALGASEDTAKKRVSRALEKLRAFFMKRGISSTTAVIAGVISVNSVQAAPVTLAKTVTAIAVVKGAAASGSTLTLIKGALKFMAWTKAKIVVCAGVAILFAVGTMVLAIQHQHEHQHDALIKRLGEDFMKDPASVGLSIGFFNNGESYFYNFGTTEKGKALPPSQNTVYEIGSITKTFTSLVLANAVSEGKVRLDDDIRKYLEGNYLNLEYEGKGITLAELVNGTSGLPNFLPSILNENGTNTREAGMRRQRVLKL